MRIRKITFLIAEIWENVSVKLRKIYFLVNWICNNLFSKGKTFHCTYGESFSRQFFQWFSAVLWIRNDFKKIRIRIGILLFSWFWIRIHNTGFPFLMWEICPVDWVQLKFKACPYVNVMRKLFHAVVQIRKIHLAGGEFRKSVNASWGLFGKNDYFWNKKEKKDNLSLIIMDLWQFLSWSILRPLYIIAPPNGTKDKWLYIILLAWN